MSFVNEISPLKREELRNKIEALATSVKMVLQCFTN